MAQMTDNPPLRLICRCVAHTNLGDRMSSPAQSGLFVYAKDLRRLSGFYETLLGMSCLHAAEDIAVLQAQDLQLIVHRIPEPIASAIAIASPPELREEAALKFFFTVPNIEAVRLAAVELGGRVLDTVYEGPGFRVCNACDPEGNIFQVRQHAV
jgi:predicted enzyme related to lactoylglutathione lyase